MAQNEQIANLDYSGLYTEMNKARTRLGRPSLTVPNVSGNPVLSSQIKNAESDLDATRLSDSRISSRYSKTILSNIDVGNVCLYSTISQFRSTTTLYQNVPYCYCDGDCCDSDCCDNEACGHDCWDCGCDMDGCSGGGDYCDANCICETQ